MVRANKLLYQNVFGPQALTEITCIVTEFITLLCCTSLFS